MLCTGLLFVSGEGGIRSGGTAAYHAGLRRERVTGASASVALCTPPSAFESFLFLITKKRCMPHSMHLFLLTERVGFEPTRPFGQTVFKTASL